MAVGILRQRKPDKEQNEKHREQTAVKSHHVCRARLKRSASTSAILCAFGVQSVSELQTNLPTACPEWILTVFAVCTTCLVSVHIIALVISNFVLPNIDYLAGRTFHGSSMKMIEEYPNNEYARNYIELAWTFSTVVGMFLALVQIGLLCWVKFFDFYISACWAGTIIVVPFMALFLGVCLLFHRELLTHSYKLRVQDLKDIEGLQEELELASIRVIE